MTHCVRTATPSPELQTRLAAIMSAITRAVHTTISRALCGEHQATFTFILLTTLLRHSGAIPEDHWWLLLRLPTALDASSASPVEGVEPMQWALVRALDAGVPALKGVAASLASEGDRWDALLVGEQPWGARLPPPYGGVEAAAEAAAVAEAAAEAKAAAEDGREGTGSPSDQAGGGGGGGPGERGGGISGFERLLLIRALRPHALVGCIAEFIADNLGREYVERPPLDLPAALRETAKGTPLVFLLARGADPLADILRLAADHFAHLASPPRPVSLGQGQGPLAEQTVAAAARDGGWCVLQNCHLAASWMPALESLVQELSERSDVHEDFRLLLTTAPSASFPRSVLQARAHFERTPHHAAHSAIQ